MFSHLMILKNDLTLAIAREISLLRIISWENIGIKIIWLDNLQQYGKAEISMFPQVVL